MRDVTLSIISIIVLLQIIFFAVPAKPAYSLDHNYEPLRVVVLPFADRSTGEVDLEMAAGLGVRLGGNAFIEVVPLDIEVENILKMEAIYMWGGIASGEKEGGMVWRLNNSRLLEISRTYNADFTVAGAYVKTESSWEVEISLEPPDGRLSQERIHVSGKGKAKAGSLLSEAAAEIVHRIEPEYFIRSSEADLRLYLAGMKALKDAVMSVHRRIARYPDSLALRVLLLNMYLYNRGEFAGEIAGESSRVMKLYRDASREERRYLLFRDIDPFDILASDYEKRDDQNGAIAIREEALNIYPANSQKHRERLAEDYYRRAVVLRDKGMNDRAVRDLQKAVQYSTSQSKTRLLAEDLLKQMR